MSDSVRVTKLPSCDIHKYELGQDGVPASYDARTIRGQWANVCEEHFKSHTSQQLGTGYGQRLIVAEDA